jgi:hypothetical protein
MLELLSEASIGNDAIMGVVKLLVLAVCCYGIYVLVPKSKTWRKTLEERMKKTFKRTGLYIEESKGKKTEKLYPELQALEEDGPFYVFHYKLIPGMAIKQYAEKKPFFDAAFNAETYVTGSGSQMIIKVERDKHQRLSL